MHAAREGTRCCAWVGANGNEQFSAAQPHNYIPRVKKKAASKSIENRIPVSFIREGTEKLPSQYNASEQAQPSIVAQPQSRESRPAGH